MQEVIEQEVELRIQEILQIMQAAHTMNYIGEPISQLEHALQCAKFAKDSGTIFLFY